MGRRPHVAALTLMGGIFVGVSVFVVGSRSFLGLTLLGRTILLLVIPVLLLLSVYGLKHRPAVTIFTILALLVRVPTFRAVPTIDDGAFYLTAARQLLSGEIAVVGHIGSAVVWGVFVGLFDQSGVNTANLVFSTATVPLVGVIGRRVFESRHAGLGSMAALALSPIPMYYSGRAMNEPLALFFLGVVMYLLLTERYSFAAAVTSVLVFMRIEYALMFVGPYAAIRATSRRSSRIILLALPAVGVGVVLLSAIAGIEVPLWQMFVGLLRGVDLFSPSPIVALLTNPRTVFVDRYQAFAAHMTHWGVPYWNLILLNPVIPVAAVLGVVLDSRRRRLLMLSGSLTVLGFAVVFIQSQLRLGGLAVSLVTIGVSLAVYTGFVYFAVDDDLSNNELIASAYVYSLGTLLLPPSPRYLLPVVLVYAVYAGRGLELTFDSVATYVSA